MLRVLHVFGSLDLGGAESRIMDVYRNIDRSKIQFDFAVHTAKPEYFHEEIFRLGGRIFHLPKFKGINYFNYQKKWKELLTENPEIKIIHGHMTTTAFIYLKIAKKNKIIKRIVHARSSNKDTWIKNITSKLSRFQATHFLAVSKTAAVSEFGKKISNTKAKILYNGIPFKNFYYSFEKRIEFRKDFAFSENQKIIVHIGRFHKAKNHKFLLKVFKSLSENNQALRLLLIGEGPLLNQIKSFVNKNNLSDIVYFLGIRNDINEILNGSDLFLFPSFYEGLPSVVIESQLCDLPIICSSNITREVKIGDNIEFIPTKKKNHQDWIMQANYYLYKKERTTVGTSGFDKFDLRETTGKFINIYLDNDL